MKGKRLPKLIIVVALVAVLAIAISPLVGCARAPAPTEPTAPGEEVQTWHLRGISCQAPPIVQRDSVEQLCDVITKMSGGRVTFDWYSGGEIMPSEEEISALQAGTIDIDQWFPAMAPITDIGELEAGLPFMTENALEFQTLIDFRGLGELFAESYEELGGIHYIGNALHDPQDIVSVRPIHTIDDFKGLKLQVPSQAAPPFEMAGADCVWYPVDEIYMAGKTGIVDAYFGCGASEIVDWGLNEVYDYCVVPAIVNPCNVAYVINQDVWDSMPEDIQAIFYYAVRHNSLWNMQIRHEGESRNRLDFGKGVSFLDDDCIAQLREYSMAYLDEYAKKSPRAAKAVQIIKDYHKELEDAGMR